MVNLSNLNPFRKISISNEEFLATVFGTARWDQAHVCAFAGDPARDGRWKGNRWARLSAPPIDPTRNNYFSVALCRDDPQSGHAHRTKALFAACYCLVVDDVETKCLGAVVRRGLGAPTWRLETSPGNFQWGYRLASPETDAARVTALIAGLLAAGLSADGADPGMAGPTRYARLPVGANGKAVYGLPPPGFPCVMHEWAPGRVHTMEGLALGFGVALPAARTDPDPLGLSTGRTSPVGTGHTGPVAAAAGNDADVILQAIRDLGDLTGGRAGNGGWHCLCPARDDHTRGSSPGCEYLTNLAGSWVCHHNHCDGSLDNGHPRRFSSYYGFLDARLAAAGLEPMRRREFAVFGVDPGERAEIDAAAAEVAGSASVQAKIAVGTRAAAFLDEHVFVRNAEAFYSLRSGEFSTSQTINAEWAVPLRGVCEHVDAKGQVRAIPVAKWFWDRVPPEARQVADKTTYWPGEARVFTYAGVEYVNLWQPNPALPKDLSRRITNHEVEPWLKLAKHWIGPEGGRILVHTLDWLALVATTVIKPGWGVVFGSGQGTGKDLITLPITWAVGEGNHTAIGADALASEFTGYGAKRFVLIVELKQNTRGAATGHDQYTQLKRLIDQTRPWFEVNPKYGRLYRVKNTLAVAITSNEKAAAAIPRDDRRLLVVSNDAAPWSDAQFAAVAAWLTDNDNAGHKLVYAWLAQRWARMSTARRAVLFGRAPMTQSKAAMIEAAADIVETWVRERVADAATSEWPDLIAAGDIVNNINRAIGSGAEGLPRTARAPSAVTVGHWLGALGAEKIHGGQPIRVGKLLERLWAIRNIPVYHAMTPLELARARNAKIAVDFSDTVVVPLPPSKS